MILEHWHQWVHTALEVPELHRSDRDNPFGEESTERNNFGATPGTPGIVQRGQNYGWPQARQIPQPLVNPFGFQDTQV